MFWRLFSFVLFMAAGGLAGWYARPWLDAFIPLDGNVGVVGFTLLGACLWVFLDFFKGSRLLRWVKDGDSQRPHGLHGLWGELADRVRRQHRAGDQLLITSDRRLKDFLAAIQASPHGVATLDSQNRIEWFNQTAATHFGLDASRDLLQHVGNLLRDPEFTSYLAALDFQQEVVVLGRASASTRAIKLAVRLHPYSEGRHLLLSRDITLIEQADTMRRDFVANVSHEIRTPLTVLVGFVETLQTLPLPETQRKHYMDMMAQQAARMQTLVEDLLTLSKLEGSPPVSDGLWVSVHTLLREVAQEARTLSSLMYPVKKSGGVGGSGVQGGGMDGATAQDADGLPRESTQQFRFTASAGSEISGSHVELQSAMANLVCNAVRYGLSAGVIDVAWKLLPDGRGQFSVQDNGPGIAPEHLPRLTERFYRIDRSRSRETGGTGLGLAIVKHVAQRHDAELLIVSQPGQGSNFSLILPAHRVRRPKIAF